MKSVYKTFIEQQRKDSLGPYRFSRKTDRQGDTLLNDGYGSPVRPVGLIVSSFRPSDDATLFGFLIPSNMFAVTSLRQLAEMMRDIKKDNDFARQCDSLADEVAAAIENTESSSILNSVKYMHSKQMASTIMFSWTMPMFRVCWQCLTWDVSM